MTWNWQLENWPKFTWDQDKLTAYERSFIEGAGIIIGSSHHISKENNQGLLIELMCTDALDSSERDLNDLVKKNILKRTRERKTTRYFLNMT